MKRMLLAGLFLIMAVACFGQRRAGFGIFPRGHVFEHKNFFGARVTGLRFPFQEQGALNLGIPPVTGIPFLGVNQLGVDLFTASLPGFNRRFGLSPFSEFGFGGFPLLPVIGEGYGYNGAPSIVVLQPVQMAYPQPPRPQVAKPALHEYKEPAETAGTVASGSEPTFTLALRDGSRQTAILVWVQESVVHYIDPAGKTLHVPLSTVDRDATEQLNRQKNVELHLPAQST